MEKLFNNIPNIDKSKAKKFNPQILAFVGDGVYTLYIRTMLSAHHDLKGGEMHSLTTNFVKAHGQSDAVEKLLPLLNDDELAIFKRARNFKTQNIAKHASVIDYKRATGFEAVLGYLFLIGEIERLNQILALCYEE